MSEFLSIYGERQPSHEDDVTKMTEGELIELSTTLETAITPLGELAMNEYMKRRGEVINKAIAERQRGSES